MKRLLALAMLAGLLSACVTPEPPSLEAKITTFQQITPDLKGKSVVVVASPVPLNDTLEFATYRKLVEAKLAQQALSSHRTRPMPISWRW